MCPLNSPCGFHLNVPTTALGFLSVKYFSWVTLEMWIDFFATSASPSSFLVIRLDWILPGRITVAGTASAGMRKRTLTECRDLPLLVGWAHRPACRRSCYEIASTRLLQSFLKGPRKIILSLNPTLLFSRPVKAWHCSSCEVAYKAKGCFQDSPDRVLKEQVLNERDKTSKVYGGRMINWRDWNNYMQGFACRCAKIVKAKGYKVFGLQFYGKGFKWVITNEPAYFL